MADFTVQVTNFEKHGSFNYRFDEAGNVVLNPSSSAFQQHYLSIPLSNVNYNNNKIKSFYDVEFTEFVAPATASANALSPAEITDQINSLTAENQELQDRLGEVIALNEINNSAANIQAVKDIIIGLRITLGQGTVSSDFQSDFPYLPIPVEERENAP